MTGTIKNTIKKVLPALAGAALASNAAAFDSNLSLRHVMPKEGNSITRTELVGTGLPLNSDIYGLTEQGKDNEFYLGQSQVFPITSKNIDLGLVGQATKVAQLPIDYELGAVVRLKGSPIGDSYGQLDIRYAPESEKLTSYGFIDSKNVFGEITGVYDPKSDYLKITPGLDYKIGNWRLGGEVNIEGLVDKLEPELRARIGYLF